MRFSPASGLASRSPPPAPPRASFCSFRSTGLGRPTCASSRAPPLQRLHALRGRGRANLFQAVPAWPAGGLHGSHFARQSFRTAASLSACPH